MSHTYSTDFYAYINNGSRRSARAFGDIMRGWMRIDSVLDAGCGCGAWLAEWRDLGVARVTGLDGAYVDRERLLIPANSFTPTDLSAPFALNQQFDLVQSLEVAEHLPETQARAFVESLVAHGTVILFSAATVGQGGENHINEQPLAYWQRLFAAHGYHAYDVLRPLLASNRLVEPWYRYNAVIYANAEGAARLPEAVRATRVAGTLANGGSVLWKTRCMILSLLPRAMVTGLAMVHALARSRLKPQARPA